MGEQETAAAGTMADAPRRDWSPTGLVTAAIAAALTALFAAQIPTVAGGAPVRVALDWIPGLDVRLSFLVDGLSVLFALMISGIGVVVALYSLVYMAHYAQRERFFLYLLLFMVSMLGLVLADNLITLFVFWELTTVSSFLLIGFTHEKPESRRNALQALLVTAAGGLALLAGLVLLGIAGGSFELSELLAGGSLADHRLYGAILVLVLLGAFTKSAQVPFHFWLPNAMAAPTPVSAYLHSATMVKGGVYLLARLNPVLGGTDGWIWSLTIAGTVTAVWASIWAMRQTDLKLVLAYTTLMALGTLTLLLAGQEPVTVVAAMTFLIVHSLYKAGLFLVVGIVDHASGTRERPALSGLRHAMPITAAIAAVAALSMAGFPPFLGFIGKELKYEGAIAVASETPAVIVGLVLANALMVAVAGIVALAPFFGSASRPPRPPHDPPALMWIGPAALAVMGLGLGLMPGFIAGTIVQPAAIAVHGAPIEVKLALWHGVNVPLMLSLVTVGLGLSFYAARRGIAGALERVERALPVTADRAYDDVIDGLKALAAWQTRILQGGLLRRYMAITLTTITVTIIVTLARGGVLVWPDAWPDVSFVEWTVALLIVAGALVTIRVDSRLTAICALGVVGTGIALIFLLHGAVDVAMTQLLVETLVIVMVSVALLRLPRFSGFAHPGRGGRVRHGLLSIALGAAVTVTMLAVLDGDLDRRITDFFEAESVASAFGRNIVNVILVDFRALDTLGEIGVVAVAGIGAYAMIKLRPAARRDPDREEGRR